MQKKKYSPLTATRNLAYCAMLIAVSVVLARLLSFTPMPDVRISFDKFPLFLAGLFFGPLTGGIVGFVADLTGCLLSPFGFNPILCPPAILYGIFGGIFQLWLSKKFSLPRLILGYLCPVVLGSWLYQSFALAFAYSPTTLWEAFVSNIGLRGLQFSIISVGEIVIIYLLIKTRLFDRLGVWPPRKVTPPQNK